MKTDLITIGRNPSLTMKVVNGIAERERQKQKKKQIAQRIIGFIPFLKTKHSK